MTTNKKIFDDKICHITFTHTDCKDLWGPYFGEMKKYFKSGMKHFVCVNEDHTEIPEHITTLLYNDKETYPKRLFNCLSQLNEYDYIFFDHEDMFLFDTPNNSELQKYYKVLKSGDLDHIRLIRGGSCKSVPLSDVPTLHKFEMGSKWIFSIQPSLWKIDTLKEVLSHHFGDNIWDLERKSQNTVKKMNLKAGYSHDGSGRRGLFHFNNAIYPYISTAIGKGKWNYSEYKKELGKVFTEYNIDPNIRGKNSFFHR